MRNIWSGSIYFWIWSSFSQTKFSLGLMEPASIRNFIRRLSFLLRSTYSYRFSLNYNQYAGIFTKMDLSMAYSKSSLQLLHSKRVPLFKILTIIHFFHLLGKVPDCQDFRTSGRRWFAGTAGAAISSCDRTIKLSGSVGWLHCYLEEQSLFACYGD